MCETLKIIYGCGHYERRRTKCSKYKKRKSSLRNKIFGCYSGRRDCGYVRRERSRTLRNCDSCPIQAEDLVSDRVGDGANLGRRPRVDKTPSRKEHHNAAGISPRKTHRETSRPKGYRHQEAASSRRRARPPTYDHHPKPADQPHYDQPSVPASLVALPRTDERSRRLDARSHGKSVPRITAKKSSREGSRSKPREVYVTRRSPPRQDDAPGVLSVSANRKPAFDRTSALLHPLQKAAVPAPASRRASLHNQYATGSRHAHDQPPRPDIGCSVPGDYKRSLPTASQQYASHPPARLAPPQPPKPFYEEYLDAQREMERVRALRPLGMSSRALPAAQQPLHSATSSASKQAHKSSTHVTEKKKVVQRLAGSMGINADMEPRWLPFRLGAQSPKDTESAVSFACNHAREIERQGPASGQ